MSSAYIAGYVDADGSVGITTRGHPRVRVTGTDRRHLEYLCRHLGRGTIQSAGCPRGRAKQAWNLEIVGNAAVREVLHPLLPHLRVKLERACVVYAATLYSPTERRARFKPVLTKLNQRGSGPRAQGPVRLPLISMSQR